MTMRKLLTVAALAVLISAAPFFPRLAAASPLDDLLSRAAGQDKTVAKVQEFLALKKAWEQGDRETVLNRLAREVMPIAGVDGPTDITGSGNPQEAIRSAIKNKLQEMITERLGPYSKQIDALAALLQLDRRLLPQMAKDSGSLASAPQNYKRVLSMTATAYAPGYQDNGKWGNATYMGGTVHYGIAAVDPAVIPMGSRLWVEGYGKAVAEDQGGAIKGNRIDLAFNSPQEAADYGIKQVKVYVLD